MAEINQALYALHAGDAAKVKKQALSHQTCIMGNQCNIVHICSLI